MKPLGLLFCLFEMRTDALAQFGIIVQSSEKTRKHSFRLLLHGVSIP